MVRQEGRAARWIGGVVLVAVAVAVAVAAPSTETETVAANPDAPAAVVVPPQIILKTQEAPTYPPAALAGRFSGTVTVRATVGTEGNVEDVEVLECSHKNLGFEQAAVDAVKTWLFEPATQAGEPVEFKTSFNLNFRRGGVGTDSGAFVSTGLSPGPAANSSVPGQK